MAKKPKASPSSSALLALKPPEAQRLATEADVHVFGNKVRCATDTRGHATPDNLNPAELVLHAPGGIIPLWEPNVTLRWRFKKSSLDAFENPAAVEAAVEALLAKALLAWGDAVPVKFSKRDDNHDFQIVVRENDDCDINGCVLASAFFPDAGRHEFVIYPQMFGQSDQEQVETICHELGHIFGLRHFFAQTLETGSPSEIFGTHDKFTIMNYGADSKLTDADKSDLKRLYDEVWSGDRTKINGTPIRLVRPFSSLTHSVGLDSVPAGVQTQVSAAPLTALPSPVRMITKEVIYSRGR